MPLPLAPALIVIHAALLAAVQPQPVAAVTATDPVAPAAAMFADGAESVGAHVVPAWVIEKALPPIVRVPVRLVVPGFAATV